MGGINNKLVNLLSQHAQERWQMEDGKMVVDGKW